MWYLKNILVAIDQLLNALVGGWCDESLSSHAYRSSQTVCKIIDTILFFDKDHCRRSFHSERDRLQLPPEMR